MSDAFITSPVIKSQSTSDIERKLSFNLRQKINSILKSFTERDLLFQAVNNIGIPKNFINSAYIDSRPDQELNKIYNTICVLKKEVLRIKRYSDNPKANNIFAFQSFRNTDQSSNQTKAETSKGRGFTYLKKQISPQKRIKMAIQQELDYREKLEMRENKMQSSEKLKLEFNQKRKQIAKQINKKSAEIYERQKQIQDKWFDKIISTQSQENAENSPFRRVLQTASMTKRHDNYDLVKERLEKQKIELQQHLQEREIGRVLKQKSIRQFKHRRLNSLNERMIERQLKSQEVRQRKNNYSQEEEFFKIQKMIEKELKIKETRQNKYSKDPRSSESQIQTTTMMTTTNFFRNSDVKSINYEKDDEKENQILEKIMKKNQLRENFIHSQVQKIKEKHKLEESRREAFKQSQFKLLTQISNNQSYVYQKDFALSKKPLKQLDISHPDPHEQNIKKKHENVLKGALCDQAILRLRKLPKSVLEQKLKDLKTKELRQIFAKNIAKFLN